MSLLTKVESTIKKYKLINNGDRILIGVSGGPDSLALLHSLKTLKEEYNLYLHIAHLDHMIRGEESIKDAKFIERLAREWNIPITIKSYDVKAYQKEKGLSLEDAARQVRYRFFFGLIEKFNINKVAVGHNANDQAETVLMKFLRGAGLKGLSGIYPKQGKIVRPLIEISREEIEGYCKEHNLNPRIDKSNLETIYLRNKVRLNLIPLLVEEYNNNLVSTLNKTADLLREEEIFLGEYTIENLAQLTINKNNGKLILNAEKLLELNLAIQRRVIREGIKFLKGSYQDIYYDHIDLVLDLIKNSETGSRLDLPQGIIVKLNYEEIIFTTEDIDNINYFKHRLLLGSKKIPQVDLEVKTKIVEKTYPWKKTLNDPNIACLDFSKIGKEFYLRQREDGDRFYPLGMKGSKKVKDFLIDEKIPINKRDKVPIFTTLDGDIFWVGGLRVDDRFKITDETEKILIIEIIN
jgi:tRNA(Ile)-lysidine synthase